MSKARVLESQVMHLIQTERIQQDEKWGEQNHSAALWTVILGEEFGEFCKATLDNKPDDQLYELIQVAAVAHAMIECYLRNQGFPKGEPDAN